MPLERDIDRSDELISLHSALVKFASGRVERARVRESSSVSSVRPTSAASVAQNCPLRARFRLRTSNARDNATCPRRRERRAWRGKGESAAAVTRDTSREVDRGVPTIRYADTQLCVRNLKPDSHHPELGPRVKAGREPISFALKKFGSTA